jgi:L-aspartate oxidase
MTPATAQPSSAQPASAQPFPPLGLQLPTRLAAPEPGWMVTAEVIVVGSGIAGLTAALQLRRRVGRVLLVTKTVLDSGSTRWAQGGIAAALDPEDSPADHLADTLVAGGGLCDEAAVRALVTEGPQRVRELVALGANFDLTPGGDIALTREGGHHRDRIAHAGGDATGAEISRALIAALHAVRDDPGIEVIEHAVVLDVMTSGPAEQGGVACGVTLHVIGEGSRDGVGAALGRAVVLATGGIGQVFQSTTNPREATGDGVAAALRAGAAVADLEFVQFHPTVLWLGQGARGQQTLISEAVRGEGAVLLDVNGTRFMPGVHEMAELAPRDVVAKAIVRQLAATGSDHVFLDARHLGRDFLHHRFPTIVAALAESGFDLAEDLIPVAPAQHYHSGGILVDRRGHSTLPGLYAVGECSCTGVHGANRLASNSLLEGLVFAHRIADDLTTRLAAGELPQQIPVIRPGHQALLPATARVAVQRAASSGPGVIRTQEGLIEAQQVLATLPDDAGDAPGAGEPGPARPSTAEWETANLHLLATALTRSALIRTETRGGHYREDHPDTDDTWRGRLVSQLDAGGTLHTRFAPLPDADGEPAAGAWLESAL